MTEYLFINTLLYESSILYNWRGRLYSSLNRPRVGNFGFRMNISFRRQFQFTLNFMPPPTSYGLGHTGFKLRVIFWFSLDCRPQQRLAG